MSALLLLDNVSVNTVGEWIRVDGGSYSAVVWGDNFGGGQVTLECSPDGGLTAIALRDWSDAVYNFTDNNVKGLDYIGQGLLVRAVLSGAAGASNVSAGLY